MVAHFLDLVKYIPFAILAYFPKNNVHSQKIS